MTGLDRLSLACGFLTLVLVGGLSPLTLSLLLLALGLLLRPPGLAIPRAWLLPLALLGLMAIFIAPFSLPAQSGFVGLPSFRVAVFCATLVLLALLRANQSSEELVLLAMGFSLTMACGMTTQREPYLYLMAAQVGLFALALRSRMPGLGERSGASALALLALLPVGVLTAVLIHLLSWSETQLNEWLQNFDYGLNTINFPNSTRLNALRSSQTSPMLIARVFSSQPPAYLVGRCYVRYHDFSWDVQAGKQEIDGTPQGPDHAYSLGEPAEPAREDRLELTASQSASLLLPRDAFELRIACPRLTRFGGDSWQVQPDTSFAGDYRLRRVPGRFLQQVRAKDHKPFLQLPRDLSPEVSRLAHEVAGSQPPLKQAAALEAWFHENFTYGFGYPFDQRQDPVDSFLRERPAAHCELFASSMTLMLRTLGIPSRYVVGFLVRERHPLGGYSVVRARDAHAWVEAYLEPLGWVQFDPTPPQALEPPGGLRTWLESATERLLYRWGRWLGQLKSNPWQALKSLLRAALPAVLTVLGLGLGWALIRRGGWLRRPRRPACPGPSPDPESRRMQGLLERQEAWLEKSGWRRPESVTLLQWSRRLADPPPPQAAPLAPAVRERCQEFLQTYCQVRYGQARPGEADLERLERLLAATID